MFRLIGITVFFVALAFGSSEAIALQAPEVLEVPNATESESLLDGLGGDFTSRDSLPGSLKLAVVIGILSLAPAIILMTTCYVRIIVVLTLLRQAFGVQQLPPTQVLTALSLLSLIHI